MGYYPKFPLAIPHLEARRNALLARPLLSPPKWISYNLHALAMPPAFILSQDQTLQLDIVAHRPEGRVCFEMKVCPAPTTVVAGRSPRGLKQPAGVLKVNQSKGRSSFDEFEGLHEIDQPTEGAVRPLRTAGSVHGGCSAKSRSCDRSAAPHSRGLPNCSLAKEQPDSSISPGCRGFSPPVG